MVHLSGHMQQKMSTCSQSRAWGLRSTNPRQPRTRPVTPHVQQGSELNEFELSYFLCPHCSTEIWNMTSRLPIYQIHQRQGLAVSHDVRWSFGRFMDVSRQLSTFHLPFRNLCKNIWHLGASPGIGLANVRWRSPATLAVGQLTNNPRGRNQHKGKDPALKPSPKRAKWAATQKRENQQNGVPT